VIVGDMDKDVSEMGNGSTQFRLQVSISEARMSAQAPTPQRLADASPIGFFVCFGFGCGERI
jgi:hypothetical protein